MSITSETSVPDITDQESINRIAPSFETLKNEVRDVFDAEEVKEKVQVLAEDIQANLDRKNLNFEENRDYLKGVHDSVNDHLYTVPSNGNGT
jgi:hypothetical protein